MRARTEEVTVKPFQQYAAEGWCAVRGAIPEALVRELAERFQRDAKPYQAPLLRQNGRREPNKLDGHGFMKVPLLDPHISGPEELAGFRTALLNLACSEAMLRALVTVTLHPHHVLQQIMVFEQAATPPHQDWVYLDSFPPGCLTAAWVALEDISPDATRFFVVPGSQDFDQQFPHDWVFGSTRYMEAMKATVRDRYADRITIPEMNAGDVLFWNSRLIHGSLAGTNPALSRLSIAAHYIPDGFGFGNRDTPLQVAHPLPLVETGHPIPYSDHIHTRSAEAARAAAERAAAALAPPPRPSLARRLLRRLRTVRVFGGTPR
jgi:phytanoyl-CoA hydroxylase